MRAASERSLLAYSLRSFSLRSASSPAAVNAKWTADASFTPAMAPDERTRRLADWRRAVERSRDWARDEES
jgi:glycerol kinase